MTDRLPDHTGFDELAAGHAIHALDPADEQHFLRHARQCPYCQRSVAGFHEVAAALAEVAPPADPGAELGEWILAAAQADLGQQAETTAGAGVTTTPEDSAPSRLVPLRHRSRRQWRRPAAAAAAAALIAGGGIWGGLASSADGPRPSLAACAHRQACAQVVLTASATQRAAARAIVHDGVAWLVPTAMTADPAGAIYVLWQITGAHIPLPVGSFDVRAGAHAAIRVGGLAAPYSGTWAFAVSLEHGRTIPARPSRPVALGQVS